MKSSFMALEPGALSRYASVLARATVEQLKAADRQSQPALYTVVGSDAVIPVRGILMDNPTILDQLFGFAPALTYSEIAAAVTEAEADPAVKRIVLDVNSPGGYVDGLETAAAAISQASKPTHARVTDLGASAAYWLASQADEIVSTSRTTALGSIGVATVAFKEPGVFEITSSGAPNKRPDPATDEGVAAIREELDALEAIFVADVARGRGTNAEDVTTKYGRGGIVLASEALARGMIDSMSTPMNPPAPAIEPATEAAGEVRDHAVRPEEAVAFFRGDPVPAGWTADQITMAKKAGLTLPQIQKYGRQ